MFVPKQQLVLRTGGKLLVVNQDRNILKKKCMGSHCESNPWPQTLKVTRPLILGPIPQVGVAPRSSCPSSVLPYCLQLTRDPNNSRYTLWDRVYFLIRDAAMDIFFL